MFRGTPIHDPRFADRLHELRLLRGFSTPDQLAHAAGVHSRTIRRLESGQTKRAFEHTIAALAKALGSHPGTLSLWA